MRKYCNRILMLVAYIINTLEGEELLCVLYIYAWSLVECGLKQDLLE